MIPMPHRLTLSAMSALIRARKLSPVELIDAHWKQIAAHNPAVNAFVLTLEESSRQAAREAETRQMQGEFDGPLHGVPVTIKDSFNIAGLPTRCGSRFLGLTPAADDAALVARLRRAGAIPLGKTNCPEFLANYETDNFIAGRTNNPWNLARTPGGSSGGESAAIAARFSAGGIGSDGGGSIRVPAHFTGIAGLKPTPGRCSAAGHVPTICHPGGLLGVAGPMARTVEDVRILFEVLAGHDTNDPFSAPVPLTRPNLAGLRIGVVEQFYQVPVQPSVRDAVRKASTLLSSAGIAVDSFAPQGLDRAPNLWWFFFGILPAPFTQEIIAGREDQAHWTGTEFLHQALAEPQPSAKQLIERLAARDAMRASLLRQMRDTPVLLMPACGVTAFPHRQRRYPTPAKEISQFEAMMPATPVNLLGLPSLAVPIAQDRDGLPVGVQLIGRPWEEELLLEIGARLEQARGLFPTPPGF